MPFGVSTDSLSLQMLSRGTLSRRRRKDCTPTQKARQAQRTLAKRNLEARRRASPARLRRMPVLLKVPWTPRTLQLPALDSLAHAYRDVISNCAAHTSAHTSVQVALCCRPREDAHRIGWPNRVAALPETLLREGMVVGLGILSGPLDLIKCRWDSVEYQVKP